MYKRLVILSVIILAALCGLVVMGYHSIRIRAKGMEGTRLGQFAEVAESIRQDVKSKLDEFMRQEKQRGYTEYQYYYVPDNVVPGQQQMAVLRSPFAGRLDHGFAYGNFQIEPDGTINTPNDYLEQGQDPGDVDEDLNAAAISNTANIRNNLLPVLNGSASDSFKMYLSERAQAQPQTRPITPQKVELARDTASKGKDLKTEESQKQRGKNYPIESLQSLGQEAQVIQQKRSILEQNFASNAFAPSQQAMADAPARSRSQTETSETRQAQMAEIDYVQQVPLQEGQTETVPVWVGPFETIVTGGDNIGKSIFGGQVFLVRHVKIEDRHFWQGFQLNEKKLIEEVEESASRLMRKGMSFELAQTENGQMAEDVAYSAVLDFGFGDLALKLKEIDPGWIGKEISHLRNWYVSIVIVVVLAVTLGLASLWRNARAQLRLAQKKDDFISAVSHELRTPLTSIRMYSEMLEKNWVKSQDKVAEYYRNMRHESERLSRLIENVLDFSRIQRGRKKYTFNAGDMNKCVADVVEMMRPYAALRGFAISTKFGRLGQSAFDGDAVTQIVVNLLDNAIKYARNATDKTIAVRTRAGDQFVLIEVEDHGPGVPHRQRKKIFEEFYRSGAEATRETTGTGLGLALVKKFAQAHNGFVEIINAKPTGAIFRVALAAQM